MKWLAKTLVFSAAVFAGEAATGLWNSPGAERPAAISSAEPPIGVRVMYAGWNYVPGDRVAVMRFVVFNGLDVPVTYRGLSATDALPEVRVNGEEYVRVGRCLFGVRDFEIAPGRSAEILVDRRAFPGSITADDRVTVGIYLYLPDSEKPNILAISEPMIVPAIFRL